MSCGIILTFVHALHTGMSKLVKKLKIFTAMDAAIFFPTEHFYKTTENFTKVREQIFEAWHYKMN